MKKFRWILTLSLTLIICLSPLCLTACGQGNSKKRTSYNIECTLQDNVITAKQTVSFYNNTENSFTELKFNLFANAFRQGAKYSPISAQYETRAYYAGKSYGNIKIDGVFCEDKALEYAITGEDSNILTVKLDKEIFPAETVKIDIEFTTTLAKVIARTGVNDKTINLANFYPILCGIEDGAFYECVYYANGDPFYSDCADYQVSITLPSEYTVASSGQTVKKNEGGRVITYTYSGENMRSFSMVASKEFEVLSDSSTGVEINYYHYGDTETAREYLDYAVKAMNLFNEKFGKYPYPTYSIVKTRFIQGGMEFPALVMISDSLEKKAFGEVIVHETAHQWWQTGVGNNEIKYGFLDEGLAEYSVILFYENYSEYGNTREGLIKASEQTYKSFCTVYDKIFKNVNTSMLRTLGEYSSEYEYVNIAYMKPCIMYDGLRASIGEDKFFSALKRYYNEYCFKNATPDDLVGSFEKGGASVEGYFDSFFNGKVIL